MRDPYRRNPDPKRALVGVGCDRSKLIKSEMSDHWCALRRRPGAWSLERESNMLRHLRKRPHAVARVAAIVLLVAALGAQGLVATTFMSVEPIPGGQVVGGPTLALI